MASSSRVIGVIYGAGGVPLSNVSVKLVAASNVTNGSNAVVASAVTNAKGEYSFGVAAGKYMFNLEHYGVRWGGAMLANAEPSSYWRIFGIGTVDVNGSITNNIQLPFVNLSGKTLGANSVAQPNIAMTSTVNLTSWFDANGVSWSLSGDGESIATSDSGGNYSLTITSNQAGITLTPAASTGLAANSFIEKQTQNTIKNLSLLASSSISGTVYGANAVPLPNVKVAILNNGKEVASGITDTKGNYYFGIPSGDYLFNLEHYGPNWGGVMLSNAEPSSYWRAWRMSPKTVSGNSVHDIQLPFSIVSGKTTDINGVPVSDIQLASSLALSSSIGSSLDGTSQATSDKNGLYAMVVAKDSSQIVITPPAVSGFSSTNVSGVSFSDNKLLNVILPFKDTVSPEIISGPIVRNITATSAVIEWQTNEPTTGNVSTGNFTAASITAATNHSVQLTDLRASTLYQISISATDVSGNVGSIKTGKFTTAAKPDTTPPVIILGPIVSGRTENSLVVQWITNEPAKGLVQYGVAGFESTSSESNYTTAHSLTLTGLSSNTSYMIKVNASDRMGNGPTVSRLIKGSTLQKIDISAPVLTNGPLISNIQDKSVTVRWVTDKPAISGVSWNDGSGYGVLTDSQLLTNHQQQVVGLRPNTSYKLIVSSTDTMGNGPTLSKEVNFKTLDSVPAVGPQVLSQPKVGSITNSAAIVSWTTDQPSSSVVRYGTSLTDLALVESNAMLVAQHSVPLVNLSANTLYFVQVSSVNSAGVQSTNTFTNAQTNSETIAITTLAAPVTQAPDFDMPPVVGYTNQTTAVVDWKTNTMADSEVIVNNLNFDEPPKVGVDSGLKNEHQMSITGLKSGSTYRVTVSSTDMSGNKLLKEIGTFTTPPSPDSRVPQILQMPSIEISGNTAAVNWQTDKLSDSQVVFGKSGTDNKRMEGEITYTKQHKVVLTGLSENAVYVYSIKSRDPSGNEMLPYEGSFATSKLDVTSSTTSTSTTTTTTTSTVLSTTTTTVISGQNYVQSGWNLLGNSYIQSIAVATTFKDVTNVSTVWKWNRTFGGTGGWEFYAPSLSADALKVYADGKGYGVLTTINPGEGYWVNAKSVTTMPAQSGTAYSLTNAGLVKGWNLVATGSDVTPSAFNTSLSAIAPAASPTPTSITTLWAWDNPLSAWYFYAPSLEASGGLANYISSKKYLDFTQKGKTLGPGVGFWVNK